MVSRYDVTVDPRAPNNAHAFMLELVGWNRRVLELGAASGHMTRALVDHNCRVTAVEWDTEAALQLKEIADDVIIGDLNDPLIFENLRSEYDFLLAGDVLEHLMVPQDVLNRATTLLKPHGLLVASIPNVAHADVRLALMLGNWDYRAYGILDDSHIRFFTLKSIKDLVRNAGLVITETRRVRVPAFESELAIDRSAIATQVLDVILADPEAETYQFVFSAAIDNGDYRLNRISERMLELERNLDQERIAKHVLRTALVSSDEVRLRQAAEIQRLNSELEELLRTKIFRYSRPARNIYSWLRRRR